MSPGGEPPSRQPRVRKPPPTEPDGAVKAPKKPGIAPRAEPAIAPRADAPPSPSRKLPPALKAVASPAPPGKGSMEPGNRSLDRGRAQNGPGVEAPARKQTSAARSKPVVATRAERGMLIGLLICVLAMGWYLHRFRSRADAHFRALAAPSPLASAVGRDAPVLLTLADDQTGALAQRTLAFPLPEDPNTRARVVLEKLLAEYTAPGSPHPLHALPPGVDSVDEVFLSPSPGGRGLLATVDLTESFVRLHPAGIEPETLTLLSMIGTLHANLAAVAEVRFLVDGEPRATLAGHASLADSYLAGPTAPSEAFTTR